MARFLVVGLGRFGSAVAHELQALRQDVLAVDISMEIVQQHAETLAHVVQLDGTDVGALRGLDIPQFDVCLLSRGSSLEDSVLILIHLKELGAKRIVAKALTAIQARVLETLGADQIVFPEQDMGIRMARLLVEPEVLNFIPLGDHHRVEHLQLPERRNGARVGDVARDPRVKILALRRGGKIEANPPADTELQDYDELVIMGPNELLARLHAQHVKRSHPKGSR
jgi:trk system potassium uptake protein TrkA